MSRREQITMKFKGDDLEYFEELRRGAIDERLPIGEHTLNVLKATIGPNDINKNKDWKEAIDRACNEEVNKDLNDIETELSINNWPKNLVQNKKL